MNEGVKKYTVVSTFLVIAITVIGLTYAFINQTLTGIKRQVITAGNLEIELKEENVITLENALPMYDEVGMIQKSFDFTLINKTNRDTNYALELKDVTSEDTQRLDVSLVKYGLTKDGVVTKDSFVKLKNNMLDKGKIKGNQTIQYSLRLWIDSKVEDETQIENKSLSYKIEVEVVQDIPKDPSSAEVKLFANDNLGENCKTYNDGVDTFLVGQCQNNYVWYSGKLWRVVLKNNETGAVKMITDNAITAILYNASGNATFENSYMDQWLNQEFLPTLHNYEDYLVVDSIWDATLDNSSAPSRPTGTTEVQRTVGLLNAYEYYTTYDKSDGLATFGNGYLKNNADWCLITSHSVSSVRYVSNNGYWNQGGSANSYGARPSVNLKSDIHIIHGSGTQFDPYWLESDEQKTINGITLLSTRYSGEYITFNNELYRIVEVEDSKTKITAVDKPNTLLSNQFDSSTANFAVSSIKTDLETYYQNNIINSYKSMVETNQIWYLGVVGFETNYKASICKTVNAEISTNICERTDITAIASIGLPRIGEMFASQITRGTRTEFWTLTPYNTASIVRSMGNYGSLTAAISAKTCGARPSMYLKSNVVISSTNTGDGTYEHPYDIELGS